MDGTGDEIDRIARASTPERRTIQLAEEADFSFGPVQVRPSRGEVEGPGGVRRLEPRLMQVMVALTRADGATLSRQALTERCWGGVIVGDDAINRVISILRGLGRWANGAFSIETLPRIGYRLISAENGAAEHLPRTPSSPAPDPPDRLVAVLPFDGEGGAEAQRLADGVSDAILSGLTRNGGVAVAARHSSFQFRGERKRSAAAMLGASHLVDGSVSVVGDVLRVTAYLVDAARDRTLWSDQFDAPRSDVFVIQDRIAARLVETLHLRLGPRPAAHPVDTLLFDLYTRAVQALEQPTREAVEQALAYLREVTAGAPSFAAGWACLAEAHRMRMLYLPAPDQESERTESRAAAEWALELDPRMGQAYGTLANLIPRYGRWLEVERLFQRGLEETPQSPTLRHLHAQFLMAVGRTGDGLAELLALSRLNPLSAVVAVDVASALFASGRQEEALDAIDLAFTRWPAIILVWSERVRLHLAAGGYEVVETLLDAPPPSVGPGDVNLARRRLHLNARRHGSPQDLAAAIANFEAFAQIGVAPAMVAINALTMLDQDARALAVADQVFRDGSAQATRPGVNMMATHTLAGEADSTILFRREAAGMRRLPEFSSILARIGLIDYWRAVGVAPEILAEEGVSLD